MIGLLSPGRTDRAAAIASLVVAFAIAAIFYRFGSFALECLAFLATWALLEVPAQWFSQRINGADRDPPAR